MIAENRQEFFEQLERELERLGVEDSSELLADLEEHFEESGRRGVPESETCRELGSIAEIARSCLDLKSEAINSMVARDVVHRKVSLTKPGRSVPADPTLAADAHGAEDKAEEDCVRSYTPEHIYEEVIPSASQSVTGADNGIGASGAESSQSAEGSPSGTSVGATSGSAAPQSAESSQNAEKCGTFERIGRTVDAACDRAGEAVNKAWNKAENALNKANKKINKAEQRFRPSDSYRENVNNSRHGGDIPPQYQKAQTKGGGKFVDTTGLTPNVNGGRLIGEVILDVLLWVWLIPTVFALAVAAFGGALALVVLGVICILGEFDFAPFHFITRLLFSLGFWNLAVCVFCLGLMIIKGAISLVKHVFGRHLKAIYDI